MNGWGATGPDSRSDAPAERESVTTGLSIAEQPMLQQA
jgi:hypothetical protein